MWLLCALPILALAETITVSDVAFVVLNRHVVKKDEKSYNVKDHLVQQADPKSINLYYSDESFGYRRGHWAVFPLFQPLRFLVEEKKFKWLFFLDPTTRVDINGLLKLLSDFESNKPFFIGKALVDKSYTIIHHYKEPGLQFAHSTAGFAFNTKAFQIIFDHVKDGYDPDHLFTIDFSYELALLFKEANIFLTDVEEFCTKPLAHRCITAQHVGNSSLCNGKLRPDELVFAVRTWHKNHQTRIKSLKETWAKGSRLRLWFFSNIADPSVPTIKLQTENTERGHCAKTREILGYFYNALISKTKFKWLVLVDDDTLLNPSRLFDYLKCVDADQSLLIGERYGFKFNLDGSSGHDYVTFGGGSVYSVKTISALYSSCECPENDSPDDMFFGACASIIGVQLVHSSAFHQARPADYPPERLNDRDISFHSFWNLDPVNAFRTSLNGKNCFENFPKLPTDGSDKSEL